MLQLGSVRKFQAEDFVMMGVTVSGFDEDDDDLRHD